MKVTHVICSLLMAVTLSTANAEVTEAMLGDLQELIAGTMSSQKLVAAKLILDPDFLPTEMCGCPSDRDAMELVEYGTRIGLICYRYPMELAPAYVSEEVCGPVSVRGGRPHLTFCPPGFVPNHSLGCVLQEDYDIVDKFTILKVLALRVLKATRHLFREYPSELTSACGCRSEWYPFIYGDLGWMCYREPESLVWADHCGTLCESGELESSGQLLALFCPEGFVGTCDNGCVFPDPSVDNAIDEEYETLVNGLFTMLRFAPELIASPSVQDQFDCGCLNMAHTFDGYGSEVGHRCEYAPELARNYDEAKCGPVCLMRTDDGQIPTEDDDELTRILHFCPRGTVSDCAQGCASRETRALHDEL